jgi:hypothetical protein
MKILFAIFEYERGLAAENEEVTFHWRNEKMFEKKI